METRNRKILRYNSSPHIAEKKLKVDIDKKIKLKLDIDERLPLRQAIGNAGEKFIETKIPCLSCKKIGTFKNLNKIQKNFPGIDLKCSNCETCLQVKTQSCRPNGDFPFTQSSNGAWKFPTSKNTIRETLKQYKSRVRYAIIVYNHDYSIHNIAITNILSCKDIHDSGNYILSHDNDTLWFSGRVLNNWYSN